MPHDSKKMLVGPIFMAKKQSNLYSEVAELTTAEAVQGARYRFSLEDSTILKQLALARQKGKLVLVLGAGISLPSGIEGWQALIRNAAGAMFASTPRREIVPILCDGSVSPTVQTRFCESSAKTKAGFRVHLVKALYQNYRRTTPNKTIDALVTLILGLDGFRPITDIITYNFDNLLETALKKEIRRRAVGMRVHIVHSDSTYRSSIDDHVVRVFHPHGYLPLGQNAVLYEEPIVFSETDYHQHFMRYDYWANAVQVDLFSRRMCLFVGLSFQCPNMRRLLDYVRGRGHLRAEHAAVMRMRPDHTHHFEHQILEEDLRSFNVKTAWVSSYANIPPYLLRVKA